MTHSVFNITKTRAKKARLDVLAHHIHLHARKRQLQSRHQISHDTRWTKTDAKHSTDRYKCQTFNM